MAAYDDIGQHSNNLSNITYNQQDFSEISSAFQRSCRLCEPENALLYSLEAYFVGGQQRRSIIDRVISVSLEDKGLANTLLFAQVYQLLVPLLKREEVELEEKLEEQREKEKWKSVPFNTNYGASTLGNIRLNKTHAILSPKRVGSNFVVKFGENSYNVDYVVATTFIDNPKELNFVQHNDGNMSNNRVDNLRWVSKLRRTPQKKKYETLKPFFIVPEDSQTDDEDRLSYIYRFAVAVWLTAISPTSRANDWASELFSDQIDESATKNEEIKDYLEEHGTPEDVKIEFMEALKLRNLADSLYYGKVLFYHPTPIQKKIPWTSVKSGVACIWDCFYILTGGAPAHIRNYVDKMAELATWERWVDSDRSKLLYIQCIHMICLDGFSLYINSEITKPQEVETPWGTIEGTFTSDFKKKLLNGSIKLSEENGRKFLYENKPGAEVEEILFPFDIDKKDKTPVIDPKFNVDTLTFYNIVEDEIQEFPDFNPFFQSVIDGDVLEIPDEALNKNTAAGRGKNREIKYFITVSADLKNEDPFYKPLSLFYLYFVYYNMAEIFDSIIEKYGEPEEYFSSIDYPNPFDPASDLTNTRFRTFKPYINELLGTEGEITAFTPITPSRKRANKTVSTFHYRTIPSPTKPESPVEIVVTPRQKPSSPLQQNPSGGKAKEREFAAKTSPFKTRTAKGIVAASKSKKKEEEEESEESGEESEEEITPRKKEKSKTPVSASPIKSASQVRIVIKPSSTTGKPKISQSSITKSKKKEEEGEESGEESEEESEEKRELKPKTPVSASPIKRKTTLPKKPE